MGSDRSGYPAGQEMVSVAAIGLAVAQSVCFFIAEYFVSRIALDRSHGHLVVKTDLGSNAIDDG